MRVHSNSFENGKPIPGEFAMGRPDGFGRNRNPHLAWEDVPEGTRSFALPAGLPRTAAPPQKWDETHQGGWGPSAGRSGAPDGQSVACVLAHATVTAVEKRCSRSTPTNTRCSSTCTGRI